MKISPIAIAAAFATSVLVGFTAPAGAETLTIPLNAVGGSGETGSAVLQQVGPDLKVTVHMRNPVAAEQPIHIHPGSCANSNPQPIEMLGLVVNGHATKTLKNVSLKALRGKNVINVHYSTAKMGTYVSCGAIL
jgi:hypothetical protein